MKIVYICSPLKGNIRENIENALAYCRQVTFEGSLPIAPHAYFTSFLDDSLPQERRLGMDMGMELLRHADELHVFGDTISEGMRSEIEFAEQNGIPVAYRSGLRQEMRLQDGPEIQLTGGW